MEGKLFEFDGAIKFFLSASAADVDTTNVASASVAKDGAIVDESLVRALELSAKRQLGSQETEAAIITLRLALTYATILESPRLTEDIRNGLGATLAVAGRLDEAALELEPIVSARKSRFGDAHPALGQAIHNLASLRRRQGKFEQSIELLHEELAVYAKSFDRGHPLISEAHNSLGTALRQANQTEDALAQYLLASDPKHRAEPGRRAAVLLNLASAQAALAHESDALINYGLAIDIYEDVPDSQRARATALWSRGALLLKLERGAEAVTDWRECLALRDELKNVDALLIVAPLIALAEWESKSGDKVVAAAYTARALKIAETAPSISADQRNRLRQLNASAE
jgi:tetratricopeptide (TPR) repeat protein